MDDGEGLLEAQTGRRRVEYVRAKARADLRGLLIVQDTRTEPVRVHFQLFEIVKHILPQVLVGAACSVLRLAPFFTAEGSCNGRGAPNAGARTGAVQPG
jgi:hypothetical protein